MAGRDDIRWIVTSEIIAEYQSVLRRPKFALSVETLTRWDELLAMRTIRYPSPGQLPTFPRDPKDAPFLAAAIAVSADYLITGDADLLAAKDLVTTRIVPVAEFCQVFQIV